VQTGGVEGGATRRYCSSVLSRALIIAWIATLGADRIDLLGGRGPIVLQLFHVLTAAVAVVEWRRHLRAGRLPALSGGGRVFIAMALALVTLALFSVLRSVDFETSLGRGLLFSAMVVGVGVVATAIVGRPDIRELLARGAAWGLGLAVLGAALQVLALLGVLPSTAELGPVAVNLEAYTYGALPRLSGLTADMNRGGQIALMHGALLLFAGAERRHTRGWLLVAALLVLGSLSRSTWLASLPLLAVAPWTSLRAATWRWGRAAALGAATLLCAAALASPRAVRSVEATVAPLAARFDPSEGSASAHAALWVRGVEIATRDIPTTLLGIGFGSSFRELTDFFAGNRYGNLHSGWLALWAETGVFALGLVALLVFVPTRLPGTLRGALLAIAVYNVFYVGMGDPITWLVIALAWLGLREAPAGPVAPAELVA